VIAAPRGRGVRPTPARVKEALFSILGGRLAGARVLDLYAGSGALGFEALSRGAAHVTFVEADARTAKLIAETARRLGIGERTALVVAPAERATARLPGTFDLVLADPPYAAPPPGEVFAALTDGRITTDTVIVYEHSARREAAPVAGFTLERTVRYGSVALSFLRWNGERQRQ
jgi:16S rRNA (guanine966-N2)-methyltransferase